ncbi:hypothetical protein RirG_056360 [Rhizophagus irregularis DAOM 197198w]|uniref:Uncharacterized protein n=1 Tax=Rhizophagus irregularis (strain DAOM 197198w) TaxID=1432141 RepID=A0A015N427_RHIIW|nr:hypothetical protein RirG_056360 [Rhizophagus irregularis DAOM 197198w]
MLQTLQLTLKWPTSLDSLIDFSLWTLKRRSISHNWGFQTIKLLRESGLQFDFPDHTRTPDISKTGHKSHFRQIGPFFRGSKNRFLAK